MTAGQWTPETIRALGATTDLPTLGSIFGVSRWSAYQMAHTGEWQKVGIHIIRIGTKYRVAVQSVLKVLYGQGTASPSTRLQPCTGAQTQASGNVADGTNTGPSAPPSRPGARGVISQAGAAHTLPARTRERGGKETGR